MLYIQKAQENILVLNITNNTRYTYSTYDLVFTHIMSKETKIYTINTSNPLEFTQNDRYCSIVLPLDLDDLNYEGQYQLNILGNSEDNVFTGMAILEGTVEGDPFTEYISPNETNENYIYIQE
jgi:hypothetical protein